jgi:hypothetical protein
MRVKWQEVIYDVLERDKGDEMLKLDFGNGEFTWLHITDIDEIEIECNKCDEEKLVENGTWALDAGMCETCYCAYQGG